MYNFGLKNVVPLGGLTCLFAKALDESSLWHRRLGHINFKTMNKLVRGNLVRGLPSKRFKNDHTYVACQKEKQHRDSCKTKIVSFICKPLQLFHMDLFGPVSIRSINKKTYYLVVTDDFNIFSWVFFLASKDEISEILKNFIADIENQIDYKVKTIRCDYGTEFKNRIMNEFCEMNGIRRKFSVARTSQQNGVVERKNRTLIKAARTMLVDSKLPTTFWVEAVNTACYVQNRVLVIKPHNKTPYELFLGRKHALSFMRPFRCPVTILNNLDHLGTGPNWMFDIDTLTMSMNYQPDFLGNQTNGPKSLEDDDVGKKDNDANGNSTYKMFTPVSAVGSFYVNLGRSIHANAATLPNADLPTNPIMPDLEDTAYLQDTRIFNGAYDDEVEGAVADFNNLEPTTVVIQALTDPSWIEALKDELQQFRLQKDCRSCRDDGIFISQDKYVADILKKFDFSLVKTTNTPIETNKAFLKDEEAEDVDVYFFGSMVGSLMYLTSSRPDIIYLKGQPKLGLWYHKDSPFNLESFSDSDYAGASLDRKSTTGGCQFLSKRLISWQCKKQTVVANSTTEVKYVAAANCHGSEVFGVKTGSCKVNAARKKLVLLSKS
nr:hypothetical protein [Tanacetum cinerariifolium]